MRTWKIATLVVTAAALAGCPETTDDKVSLPARPAAPVVADGGGEVATPAPGGGVVTSPAEAETAAATPVPVAPQAPAAVVMRLNGQVTAIRTSKLAFEAVGFVKEVIAKPGHVAKKGEVLATLDDDDFKLRLDLATARRELAKVGVAAAKKELERERQLKAENASTASVWDKVENGYEQARLQLRLAELDVTQAERSLADTKLKAPYDCVVSAQLKFEGENVAAGSVAIEVVDVTAPEVTFDAPEALLGKLEIGAKLDVDVPAGGFKGQAEIVRLIPVIAEKTRTFRVIAKLPEGAVKVAPGSYAEAKID